MYASNTLNSCTSIEEVVDLINQDEIREGMEGITFRNNDLAGQYAYQAAKEVDDTSIEQIITLRNWSF